MKFLCLHGAIGNPDNFKAQLDPLCKELESDGTCSFHFAQGGIEIPPPRGFEEYFGPGPHYRFFYDAGIGEDAMLNRIRDFPQAETPEDALRSLIPEGATDADVTVDALECLGPLYDTLEKDDDIQGIIGYSEGAVVASTLMLDEQRRMEATGRPKRIKCGLFFAGWPPVNEKGWINLVDESNQMIDVPSIHVIGANDPYVAGSIALYNVCEEDNAVLFDHGKGHTIPRKGQTLKELGDDVRTMIRRSSCDSNTTSSADSSDYAPDETESD